MSDINVGKIVGDSFEELTISEMAQVQGTGEVQPRTTPACLYSLYVTANVSSAKCIGFSVGLVVSINGCKGR